MATTIHEPPKVDKRREPAGIEGFSGRGGWRNLSPANDGMRAVQDYSPPPASTGVWVGITGIAMMFAAFTSAMVVRQGAAPDWRHISLPSVLYLNTLLLLASSVTLEIARKRVAAFMGGKSQGENPSRWLYLTLALGLLFVAGQYIAWRQLSGQGLYLATNPSSSFFYVFTATHAVHVLGGLFGLIYVIRKLNRVVLKRSTLDTASRYWHFMDVLWMYLLVLLWLKL